MPRWLSCCTVALAIGLAVEGIATQVLAGQPLVGAYYYPWYGSFEGGHDLRQCVRGHLVPPQLPALGTYSSRDVATIAAHIDQSRRATIAFWAVSWWGPKSAEDVTFSKSILEHPRAAELKYAVHYESPGRLGPIEKPSFENLVDDFRHLAARYFRDPNYLSFDGRPVVFVYLSRAYFGSLLSREALARLRAAMRSEFNVDPFLVGDELFGLGVDLGRAQLWDAVTAYDVYGIALQRNGSTFAALAELARVYDQAVRVLATSGVGFIPAVSPGFNDKGVRQGHPAAPRYFTDVANSRDGDLFVRMLKEIALPRIDSKARNMLLINSFNEWHEDTQIEPSLVGRFTTVDDSGRSRYSEGARYEGYGERYLDILRDATR